MRADRLLSILLLLQNRGKVTSRELAGTLEVSERTIFRDMEALSASGIPVLAERGREGGWMLTEGYRTSLTGMKPKEIGALLLSADPAILQDLGIHEDYTLATRKLEAAATANTFPSANYFNQRIHIDSEGWVPSKESFPFLSVLQTALWEDRKVNISYLRSGEVKNRKIGLLGLVAKQGVWYVIGEHDGQFRTYRVSRIIACQMIDEAYIRPDDFELTSYWESSKVSFKSALPSYKAKFSLQSSSLPVLSQERYVTVLSMEDSPGSVWLKVEAEFNTIEAACRVMLSLGPNVIIGEPEELRVRVYKAALKTVLLGRRVRRSLPGNSRPQQE
ncbi:WYL domain-containing protein [Paenibacillus sonchi]|uniref:WYL domain-containing protein n=1 Tax=Paenibacillus sonchi TaxID=373687 RepID=A0A974SBT1_9BACL|nr:WYL domain-containing protein [Paenibacillus sonchi]MCE3201965.1 WYL domain-containing protein [Paenibacillus sonchi]QQZ60718.1 WYL domain-containing protein [Paenibacillus sonchi]